VLAHYLQHTIGVLRHVIVPESDHAKALRPEPCGPPCIGGGRDCVLAAIYLHYESLLEAEKVDDVRVDRSLMAKLAAVELAAAQPRPELSLCIGQVPS
jgi:hypothetical protein